MMNQLIRRQFGNAVAVTLGLLTALIMFPLVVSSIHWIQQWYDDNNPVAIAKLAKAEFLTPSELRFQVWVTRQRDCQTMQVVGMTGQTPASMYNATVLVREDGERPTSYPMGVTVLSKPWLMSPIFGPRMMLWGYYDCDGRIVKSRIIDEVIPQ